MTSSQSDGIAPQPAYIFRGHAAQIHALKFWRANSRLVSGDGDGWVVLWDMTTRRPAVSWKAHKSSILSLEAWGDDKLITHGRDEAIRVWQITTDSETSLSKALPTESTPSDTKDPWLLHSIKAFTVSFCSISTLPSPQPTPSLLVASPSQKLGQTEIFTLPSEQKLHLVPPSPIPGVKPSMTMALQLLRLADTSLALLSGNESGHVTLQVFSSDNGTWSTNYTSNPHTQPILSISLAPTIHSFYSSSADAIIARHPLPLSIADDSPSEDDRTVIKTGHAGQQDLKVRNDERVFATAGWDSKVRVYSCKTMGELAVLKWHREAVYSVGFADVLGGDGGMGSEGGLVEGTTDSQEMISRGDHQSVVKANGSGTQVALLTARQRREWKTKNTHWIAAGSKDGKISLWDIF